MEESVIVNSDRCHIIKKLIYKNQKDITTHTDAIKEIRDNINNLNKQLYYTCKHSFIRDNTVASDELYKYICNKCGLYKGIY